MSQPLIDELDALIASADAFYDHLKGDPTDAEPSVLLVVIRPGLRPNARSRVYGNPAQLAKALMVVLDRAPELAQEIANLIVQQKRLLDDDSDGD